MKRSRDFKGVPGVALGGLWMGGMRETSLDFCFGGDRRFCDLGRIYAGLRGFGLLHLGISGRFGGDRIETASCRVEVVGCCYISVYFLKY